MEGPWPVEFASEDFSRFSRSLHEYEQAILVAAIRDVLAVEGIAICESEWGKALGRGLYEFRIRKSLDAILKATSAARTRGGKRAVLLRVFCAIGSDRVVLLLGGYDKGKDPSGRRQQREIAAARRVLAEWKRQQRA